MIFFLNPTKLKVNIHLMFELWEDNYYNPKYTTLISKYLWCCAKCNEHNAIIFKSDKNQ